MLLTLVLRDIEGVAKALVHASCSIFPHKPGVLPHKPGVFPHKSSLLTHKPRCAQLLPIAIQSDTKVAMP